MQRLAQPPLLTLTKPTPNINVQYTFHTHTNIHEMAPQSPIVIPHHSFFFLTIQPMTLLAYCPLPETLKPLTIPNLQPCTQPQGLHHKSGQGN